MHNQWTRRVIPRWRSSTISASLLENSPIKTHKAVIHQQDEGLIASVSQQIEEWRLTPSIGVAADLLNFSHVDYLKNMLQEPAQFLRNIDVELPSQLLASIKHVLGSSTVSSDNAKCLRQKDIGRLKLQLRMNPKDSIAYMDLARLYTIKGQHSHANRAVRTALALQPNNRFILRSASRFYIHSHSPEEALHILKKSPRTQEDPWLLASMIAVETILDQSPAFYKKAKRLIENRPYSPCHLAELGAALATLQINSGSLKEARRTFNVALTNPNDNAVAQALWAANEFSLSINVDENWLNDEFSSEAKYYAKEKIGNYKEALEAAIGWFDDEPFTKRPLQAATFAASIIGDYELAEEQTRALLKIDPSDIDAKNNLVFALATQNQYPEAFSIMQDIVSTQQQKDAELSGHTLANLGMLYYRSSDIEQGNHFYRRAEKLFENKKDSLSKALAMAYFAQEAKLANDPHLDKILLEAKQYITSVKSLAAQEVLSRVTGSVVIAEPQRSAVLWEHDPLRNILVISKKKPFGNELK